MSSSSRRRRLTMDETEYLLAQFYKNEKPKTKERLVFAKELNLHPRTIQVWFQNRRAKLKRDDSLARALYPQLSEEGDNEDDGEGEEIRRDESMQKGYGEPLENLGDNDADEDAEIYRRKHQNEERKGRHVCGDDDFEATAAKDEDSNGGVKGSSHTRQSLATIVKEKLKRRDDVSHRGAGTETFIGCERSDAGLDWLLDSELERVPMSERFDLTTCASGNNGSGSSKTKSDEDDVKDNAEYCDMTTLDLGLDLMYELIFGPPTDAHTRGGDYHSTKRVGDDDGGIAALPVPSIIKSGESSITSATPIEGEDHEDKRSNAQEVEERQLPSDALSRVPRSKTKKHPYP
ncbi:hypothetical protein BGZ65_005617, partial [Modicella reniformis]